MNLQSELELFAKSFATEEALRGAIQDLLSRSPGVSFVQITHGSQERGKDLVFRTTSGGFGDSVLHACVVKNGKITGQADSSNGAMTVLNQVRQALRNPYLNSQGVQEFVAQVHVITPHDISQTAMNSIQGELVERAGQVSFLFGSALLKRFEDFYPEYLLLRSELLTSYVSTLRQAFEDSGALHSLSFRNGMLGMAKRQASRAYVKPAFLVDFRELTHLSTAFPHRKTISDGLTANQLEDVLSYLEMLRQFSRWSGETNCSELLQLHGCEELERACSELLDRLRTGWKRSFSQHVSRQDKSMAQQHNERQLVRLSIGNGALILSEVKDVLERTTAILAIVAKSAKHAYSRCVGLSTGLEAIQEPAYLPYCAGQELSRTFPVLLERSEGGKQLDLDDTLLDHSNRSLLVSGPPGYGKTSFCKWSALYDGERYSRGESNILPIYVALHKFAEKAPESFDSAILGQENIKKIQMARQRQGSSTLIRLYLDGLDEVPVQRQREIMSLAKTAVVKDKTIQVVITARDHVTGPWLSWIPRVSIRSLCESKVLELVSELLDSDDAKVRAFYSQLERVPSLRPLLGIPLLCTLTTSVFLGCISLPEGKSELYRIFVDLLTGGWDLAKGIRRESQFSAAVKLRVLIRTASNLHHRKSRSASSDQLRGAVKEALGEFHSWEALIGDVVQDGLLTRDGSKFTFAHLSFQEYLCARDLADPGTDESVREKAIKECLAGNDWWRDVVIFYIGLSNRPDQLKRHLSDYAEGLISDAHRSADPQRVRARLKDLLAIIRATFPSLKPLPSPSA